MIESRSDAPPHEDEGLVPERLSLNDLPEIVSFLDRTWRAAYGAQPFPAFDETYLRWLYGGPRAGDTRLIGCRLGDRLVAFRAYLPRDVALGGRLQRAFIATHFAVDRELPAAIRPRLISTLTLLPWQTPSLCPEPDFTYAALELDKPLSTKATAIYASHGLEVVTARFAHAVVAASSGVEKTLRRVRRATLADVAAISSLHAALGRRCDLAQRVTDDEFRHHWYGAPGSEVYVSESDDGITGAICVYRLEMVSAGKQATVAICEGLLVTDVADAVALLGQGLDYRQRVKARGLVFENVSYLAPDFCHACGLLPSLRQMRLLVAARRRIELGQSWLIDMK